MLAFSPAHPALVPRSQAHSGPGARLAKTVRTPPSCLSPIAAFVVRQALGFSPAVPEPSLALSCIIAALGFRPAAWVPASIVAVMLGGHAQSSLTLPVRRCLGAAGQFLPPRAPAQDVPPGEEAAPEDGGGPEPSCRVGPPALHLASGPIDAARQWAFASSAALIQGAGMTRLFGSSSMRLRRRVLLDRLAQHTMLDEGPGTAINAWHGAPCAMTVVLLGRAHQPCCTFSSQIVSAIAGFRCECLCPLCAMTVVLLGRAHQPCCTFSSQIVSAIAGFRCKCLCPLCAAVTIGHLLRVELAVQRRRAPPPARA